MFVVSGELPNGESDQPFLMIPGQQLHSLKGIGEELVQLEKHQVHKADLKLVLEANASKERLDDDGRI